MSPRLGGSHGIAPRPLPCSGRLACHVPRQPQAAMLREVRDLDEALSAIQQQIKEWASEAQRAHVRGLAKGRRLGHKEGLEKGRREGLGQGKREGLASSLLIVLRARFGRVGRDLERRIRDAQPQQLQRWLRRAARAESLEAVFEGE